MSESAPISCRLKRWPARRIVPSQHDSPHRPFCHIHNSAIRKRHARGISHNRVRRCIQQLVVQTMRLELNLPSNRDVIPATITRAVAILMNDGIVSVMRPLEPSMRAAIAVTPLQQDEPIEPLSSPLLRRSSRLGCRRLVARFEDRGDALALADTQSRQTVFRARITHSIEQRDADSRSARAERMPERDGTTARVDFFVAQTQ